MTIGQTDNGHRTDRQQPLAGDNSHQTDRSLNKHDNGQKTDRKRPLDTQTTSIGQTDNTHKTRVTTIQQTGDKEITVMK